MSAKTFRAKPSLCRSCQAKILWTETESGSPMPVDFEPHPAGTVKIWPGMHGIQSAVPAVADREGLVLRTSHFVTCPNASSHRKPKAKK